MISVRSEILNELGVKPMHEFNPSEEVSKRVTFLKKYLKDNNKGAYVLGVSGGVDSTVAAKLAQLAVNELKSEGYNASFVAVRLPYGIQLDEDDAQAAIDFVNADHVIKTNIKPSTDCLISEVDLRSISGADSNIADFAKGNVKARERMIAQYYISNRINGLVIGTDHSAEAVTGFYTIHGDGACDIMPLSRLNKRQVRTIAEFLGAPSYLSQKAATADLEDLKEQLPDEVALGVSYNHIDDYLEGKEVPETSSKIIEERFCSTRFKRRTPTSYCF